MPEKFEKKSLCSISVPLPNDLKIRISFTKIAIGSGVTPAKQTKERPVHELL